MFLEIIGTNQSRNESQTSQTMKLKEQDFFHNSLVALVGSEIFLCLDHKLESGRGKKKRLLLGGNLPIPGIILHISQLGD